MYQCPRPDQEDQSKGKRIQAAGNKPAMEAAGSPLATPSGGLLTTKTLVLAPVNHEAQVAQL